ncbi:hypothetical protein HAX54_032589 [Datura stramonium]|uniref:NADP-dependent oxidoreductase domain-containing protein n=1 Tax=Datura stramonium TaxID=4076 RepID=A0ABS8VC99_DATST|nr:hypothetical protein [Datura stramonium]
MALHFSSACLCSLSQRRAQKIRAVAPEKHLGVTPAIGTALNGMYHPIISLCVHPSFIFDCREITRSLWRTVQNSVDNESASKCEMRKGLTMDSCYLWCLEDEYIESLQCQRLQRIEELSVNRKLKAAKTAFDASIDCGITFIDTAEVYGSRRVEVAVATKFAALPWRLGRQSVLEALKDSLAIWNFLQVDLYQLHCQSENPFSGYIDGLGDAVEQGLVKAVGVSNYSEKRLRNAYEQLKRRGIPLASNPRALTGKYTPEHPPAGPGGQIYTPEFLTKLQPLINRIKEIGESYSKTSTQVVLNWLIAQENVVPIPGAKNAEQAKEFAGALG